MYLAISLVTWSCQQAVGKDLFHIYVNLSVAAHNVCVCVIVCIRRVYRKLIIILFIFHSSFITLNINIVFLM